MYLSEKIAANIHSLSPADISDDAFYWAMVGTLDTVGVTLAGARESMVDILAGLPGVAEAQGVAVVQGRAMRTSAPDAVFLNGVASHAHDYDDVSSTIGGHPSVMLSPAIQAISDMRKNDDPVSGEEALTAYVVGYEAMMRVAKGVNFHHYNKGWHPTVTIGIFGTVAAVSRLLRLSEQQTAMALAHAVSLASGVKANFGSMVKPYHVGHALRNAMMACFAAQQGFLARPDAFEAPQGYLDVFNGAGNFDIDAITTDWGKPFDILEVGLGLKQYPCCGSTHAPVNCALEIRSKWQPNPEAIRSIDVQTHPLRIPHTNTPDPKSLVQAKFSTQYCVSRALLDGAVRMSDFEGDRPWQDSVRTLMSKVTFGPHPDMPMDGNNHFAGEVFVTMEDGTVHAHRQNHVVGRGIPNPMTDVELWEKYGDCAARSVSPETARRSFDLLLGMRELDDIARINDVLCEDA